MTLFLDLDGVLADFVGGILLAHGRPWPDRWPPGHWEMAEVLGLTPYQFWLPACCESFWADLPLTPECSAIVSLAERYSQEVFLCSTPSQAPESWSGKLRWIGRHLPAYTRRTILMVDKALLAGPWSCLVDDNDENVARFRAFGGQAVLVPRHWNSMPGQEVLPYLEEQLQCQSSLTRR